MKEILTYVIENRILQKLTLSKCVDKEIIRTTGRLIEIKGKLYLALECFYTNGKAIQKNIPDGEAVETLLQMIPASYKQANLITTGGNCEIKVSRSDKITVIDRIKRSSSKSVDLEHNRKKQYIIPEIGRAHV